MADFCGCACFDQGSRTDPASGIRRRSGSRKFDAQYGEQGQFILTTHPHVTGHRVRNAYRGADGGPFIAKTADSVVSLST
jgi:hypothetical protein